ncbi:hypothetical protein [Spongiivirga citrea]|uniref:Lipoprotein n=1 Tax=Spongiivirga citrea TaxID=1481457 RepID=A0A6M0CDP6_9FLAO|nr:hypothetical protein [Spongiivirga citrea]NER15851.1 hypothetical protein [Spongiivirga citrea]
MKLTHVLAFFAFATIISCNGTSSKQNVKMEKQLIEEKNYPKTNNYPEADRSDSDMEKDFVNAYNDSDKKELTALNAIITSRDWVVYNDNLGRPIKRNRIAVVTAQIEDRCFLQHLFFQQDAQGSNYGKTYVSDVYGWKEFDCSLKN